MGVAWFPCESCEKSVCDCGPHTRCDCGRRWCDYKCAVKDGHRYNDEECESGSCNYCRGEDAEDVDLFAYLMSYHGVTRADVLRAYLESRKDK